jgi:hypothetical protein
MQPDFFKTIGKKLSREPSEALDHLVLTQAKFSLPKKRSNYRTWMFSTATLAASLFVWFQVSQTQLDKNLLKESIELIAHHDEVEMWVEAADWSEEDWAYLERGES